MSGHLLNLALRFFLEVPLFVGWAVWALFVHFILRAHSLNRLPLPLSLDARIFI